MTADELLSEFLAGRVALCIECRELTRAPIPVRWIQSNSGPGTTLYACPDHAVTLGAGPTPEDVLRAP
ncbi:hypothetical protein ACFXPV_29980 [Streptomyces sp. NPDC059118]|uniref:hypothetical protein n=1 Tax=unclassified Streptomyces TaxID=2593676 RepID=UPI0036927A47